jgi:hypothetical protein
MSAASRQGDGGRVQAYECISADSHWQVPHEVWAHRVPKEYRERLPKRI